jgi:electron transfer flavoprotein alpha subunit
MSGVLVIAEHRRGEPAESTHELIAAGLRLGSEGAGEVRVAVIGGGVTQLAERCGADGLAEVVAFETEASEFEPHLAQAAVEKLLDDLQPAVILTGHTVDSFGFAPALAAWRRLGFAPNVTAAEWNDGALRAHRGVYGDRLVAALEFDRDTTLLMLRPGAVAAVEPASTPVRTERLDAAPLATHIGYREAATEGVDITKSEFLLSIGRGVGEEENIERFSELAEKLGATLSASRPLIDAGWVPSARQVGQSGRTVKPKVYLALGISGAAQHLAGIRDAGTVIAVNTDAEAPIFGVADYGSSVDLFDLADELEARV